MKPNDIICAWLAGLSIWALAMLGLVMAEQSEVPIVQTPPSHGIMVEDWYAKGFPDEDEAEAIWEHDWDDDAHVGRTVSGGKRAGHAELALRRGGQLLR